MGNRELNERVAKVYWISLEFLAFHVDENLWFQQQSSKIFSKKKEEKNVQTLKTQTNSE